MPPRWAVYVIVAFWLAATGWLIQRDMVPYWFPPAHDPPPFDIDMTDEIGSNHTNWKIVVDGEDYGDGASNVRVLPDDNLEFKTVLRFHKPLFKMLSYLGSTNRITTKGELKGMSINFKVKPTDDQYYEVNVDGRIEDGQLKSKLSTSFFTYDLEPMKVPENGIVFNAAHLGTRIRNLRNGQTWRVPVLDISSAMKMSTQGTFDAELHALVSQEVIRWSGEDVLCFKIDMNRPGKEVEASTWVRSRDGQVLKQRARLKVPMDIDMMLIRVPGMH